MTEPVTLADRSAPGGDPAQGRLRVVFTLRVAAAAQQQFLDAYQRIRYQVAGAEGYLSGAAHPSLPLGGAR